MDARKWYIVDANGIPLGRLASEVASLIRGKNLPTFTPHVDGGGFVVVINADLVVLTGNKVNTKRYIHHTGYVGGIKDIPASKMLSRNPERMIQLAVRGMLPKGVLGHRMLGKLKVYTGTNHPHGAQSPETFKFKYTSKAA